MADKIFGMQVKGSLFGRRVGSLRSEVVMRHHTTRARLMLVVGPGLGLLMVAASCSRPFSVGTDGVRMGTDRSDLPASADSTPGTGFTRKEIAAKEPPSTLVARDRTQCIVNAERFAETHVGKRVWCMWR